MLNLRYLCLFAYNDVQHILCCVFDIITLLPFFIEMLQYDWL